MSKYILPKQLRIMDLLAQKRSANYIVHTLGVSFHEVNNIWKKKAFKVKKDPYSVFYYYNLFKE